MNNIMKWHYKKGKFNNSYLGKTWLKSSGVPNFFHLPQRGFQNLFKMGRHVMDTSLISTILANVTVVSYIININTRKLLRIGFPCDWSTFPNSAIDRSDRCSPPHCSRNVRVSIHAETICVRVQLLEYEPSSPETPLIKMQFIIPYRCWVSS